MADETIETVKIAADEQGQRLDRVLAARIPALSRSRLKALILDGQVTIQGAIEARTIRDPASHVNSGDTVTVTLPAPEQPKPAGEAIPLNVVYEDDALIVLDKATTGLMVVAKTDAAHRALSAQFANKSESGIERGYLALVWGAPGRPKGTINAPLDRHPQARDKRAVRAGGRQAVTHWQALERYVGADGKPVASLLACTLETGRTHQIRVHLAHIGHPILGDASYGTGFKTKASLLSPAARAALEGLGRQALHAYLLVIEHPITRDVLRFRSELPSDLGRLRHALAENPSAGRKRSK